jgi:DNA-binding transcriptional LysR family regulator
MKLHQLRDVLTVAEKGSLRAAARHLGVTQPGLTRSIRELERELGVPLFERQARGTVLTPMGRLFARRAGVAASELRRAREEIEQWSGGVGGGVTVCLTSVPLLALLPSALPAFIARYTKVQLSIIESAYLAVESRLRDGSVDFYAGVAPEKAPGTDLVVEELFTNERVVLARHGHPLSGARSLAQLVDAGWVTTSITDQAEAELGELFRMHGLKVPRLVARVEGGALGLLMAVLANSDLIAILPKQWTEFSPTREALQKIDVREDIPAPPITLIRRAALPLTPAAEYLCDMLRRASGQYLAAHRAAKRRPRR